MKITRHGASSYHGVSEINLSCPTMKWDSDLQRVKANKMNVKDFSTDSRHNYTVEIPIEEICKLLDVMAVAAKENPSQFEQCLGNSLKSIAMLQAVVSGIKT